MCKILFLIPTHHCALTTVHSPLCGELRLYSSVCMSLCLCLYVCDLSVSLCLCVSVSLYLCVSMSLCLYVYVCDLSVSLCLCVSVSLCICDLSVSLSLSLSPLCHILGLRHPTFQRGGELGLLLLPDEAKDQLLQTFKTNRFHELEESGYCAKTLVYQWPYTPDSTNLFNVSIIGHTRLIQCTLNGHTEGM